MLHQTEDPCPGQGAMVTTPLLPGILPVFCTRRSAQPCSHVENPPHLSPLLVPSGSGNLLRTCVPDHKGLQTLQSHWLLWSYLASSYCPGSLCVRGFNSVAVKFHPVSLFGTLLTPIHTGLAEGAQLKFPSDCFLAMHPSHQAADRERSLSFN